MKLFIDEDLSPTLTEVCHASGYEATCVRDRGQLQRPDFKHSQLMLEEDWVFVTNNAGDFLKLAHAQGIHPGLIFMPLGSRDEERAWMQCALEHIRERSVEKGCAEADLMVNHVVDVAEDGTCSDYAWPT